MGPKGPESGGNLAPKGVGRKHGAATLSRVRVAHCRAGLMRIKVRAAPGA
jgi:hypothetical protein